MLARNLFDGDQPGKLRIGQFQRARDSFGRYCKAQRDLCRPQPVVAEPQCGRVGWRQGIERGLTLHDVGPYVDERPPSSVEHHGAFDPPLRRCGEYLGESLAVLDAELAIRLREV